MEQKNKKNQTAVSNEEIIAALISSGSIAQAAEATGIAPRTMYDRMGTREFKAAYSAAKSDIVRTAVFTINNKLEKAIETIAAVMEDEKNPAATRLQAAKIIVDNASKFAERLHEEERYTGEMAKKPMAIW